MSKKRKAILAVCMVATLLLASAAWIFDFPGLHDDRPAGIGVINDPEAKYRVYPLGGYLDQEYLIEVECNTAGIRSLISDLQVEPVPSIPARALRLTPWYWPKPGRTDLQAYQSRHFDPNGRGQDGSHYLLLHDPKAARAYVWWKDNF